jgi:hypothetical protein
MQRFEPSLRSLSAKPVVLDSYYAIGILTNSGSRMARKFVRSYSYASNNMIAER